MQTTLKQDEAAAPSLAGKYLTFGLGRESYGIGVLKIREIIRMFEITPVPELPKHIRGVINLRGKIIPVIDLRCRFGISRAEGESTERNCTVVVHVERENGETCLMGLIVDAVEEVILIREEEIEPTPRFGGELSARYILGMVKIKGKVKTLLDIDAVLAADAAEILAGAAA
ncbi:purine-binding chemotaxis protein CheW [Verrucomicrobium sp. GAS474]|uniref:chemotaxis protein CheW n=1 Tax=Verrucomicrobium sp. GAS474 TaxID=1882831 RepID=UPI00087A0C41|nr:chemotaxis protein CheW [Verrucomicrobium sp. GAS474]SDU01766.1 purine-binding chemotaxis protein CheW [Verrucomicrobium sp. GAS474]